MTIVGNFMQTPDRRRSITNRGASDRIRFGALVRCREIAPDAIGRGDASQRISRVPYLATDLARAVCVQASAAGGGGAFVMEPIRRFSAACRTVLFQFGTSPAAVHPACNTRFEIGPRPAVDLDKALIGNHPDAVSRAHGLRLRDGDRWGSHETVHGDARGHAAGRRRGVEPGDGANRR